MRNFPLVLPGEKGVIRIEPTLKPKSVYKALLTMVFNPQSCWPALRADGNGFKKIIEEQVFFLALIPAVFGFIGYSINGNGSVGAGIRLALLGYVCSLLFIFGAAYLAHKTAKAFAGKDSIDVSGKLVVYSLIPFFVSSVFLVHPSLSPLVLLGGFGAYEFFQGAEEMTDVPADRLLIFCAINIVVWVLVLDRLLVVLFA